MVVGMKKNGMLYREFESSNNWTMQVLSKQMHQHPQLLTKTNFQGIQRVRAAQGPYAFILPKHIAEFYAGREPCDLIFVDNFLNEHYFALAVPKDSPHLTKINTALARLEQRGVLDKLYKQWWTNRRQCDKIAYMSASLSACGLTHNSHFTLIICILGHFMHKLLCG